MRYIDLHCDTVYSCYVNKQKMRTNTGHIDLLRLKSHGYMAQFFAIFIPSYEDADEDRLPRDAYQSFSLIYNNYLAEMEQNKDIIRPAFSYDEMRENDRQGYLSSFLTIEDGALLNFNSDRLVELYKKGVRMITLTWNYENCLGYPNSTDPLIMEKELTHFGKETVLRMNSLGMIVDVSHLSDGGFWNVAELLPGPFVASHSCARALCPHPRNLSDQQLRTLAEHGGVVGVNFKSDFITEQGNFTSLDGIKRHICHIKNIAGVDTLAIGTDFDGIDNKLEIAGCEDMELLANYLNRFLTASDVEKICYRNALRVIKDICR